MYFRFASNGHKVLISSWNIPLSSHLHSFPQMRHIVLQLRPIPVINHLSPDSLFFMQAVSPVCWYFHLFKMSYNYHLLKISAKCHPWNFEAILGWFCRKKSLLFKISLKGETFYLHTSAGWTSQECFFETFCQAGVKAPAGKMISPHELRECSIDSEKILPDASSTTMWKLSAVLKCLL